MPSRTQLLHGPGHPVFLAAVALLLVNDHILKARFPGPWTTGKLSDVAWLIVAPVLLGALLAFVRVPPRATRWLAIAVPAVAFTVLQLWPPLGDAWVSVMGGAHIADAADLLTLPALLLVPLAWRSSPTTTRRSVRTAGAVVGATALMATSYVEDPRNPCPDTTDWDPAKPLIIQWSYSTVPDNPALLATGISLQELDGDAIPVDIVRANDRTVLVCPQAPLAPDTTYTWTVGDWDDLGMHVQGIPGHSGSGRWTFTTASTSSFSGSCTGDLSWVKTNDCYVDTGVQ